MIYYKRLKNKFKKLTGWLSVLVLFGAIAYISSYFEKSDPSNMVIGQAYASDGDSLKIAGIRIRLLGIDAPELHQNCKDKNNITWKCGLVSHKRMASLVRGNEVTCLSDEEDRYGRLLAKCTVENVDVGGILVLEGLAVSYRGSGDYLREQNEAKKNKRGMWAGEFENPQDWRKNNPRN